MKVVAGYPKLQLRSIAGIQGDPRPAWSWEDKPGTEREHRSGWIVFCFNEDAVASLFGAAPMSPSGGQKGASWPSTGFFDSQWEFRKDFARTLRQ